MVDAYLDAMRDYAVFAGRTSRKTLSQAPSVLKLSAI